jgi:hypothetical protein
MMDWRNILKSPLRYKADEERDNSMNFPSAQEIRAFEKENIEPKFERIVAKQPFGSKVSLTIALGERDDINRFTNLIDVDFIITPSMAAKLAGYSPSKLTRKALLMLYNHILDELSKIYKEEGFIVNRKNTSYYLALFIEKNNEMRREGQ